MSQRNFLWLLDRVPRWASLLGVLGLIGLAGLVNPVYYRFSALSFLTYLAFFRFFRRLGDPTYGPTAQGAPWLIVPIVVAAVAPWLLLVSPLLGFLGFLGWGALCDAAPRARAEKL